MANAKRDSNYVTTLLAVSNVDGETPVTLYADPTTHRLLVSALGGAIDDLSDVVITSGAQGDVLYHNGTNWVNLPAGTSGQFLKTNGAGANPEWAAGGSSTITVEVPTGTVDGSNTDFVFSQKPGVVVVNGASYRETKGWTWDSGTLTATIAFPAGTGGDVYGIL